MPDVTINGATVITGDLLLPRTGAWTAWLHSIDTETVPTGAVQIVWLGTTLRGTVIRSGDSEGRVSAYVVGGAGGLHRLLPARGYDASPPVSLILGHILSESHETLSSDARVTGTVSAWARAQGEGAAALDVLAEMTGSTWRIQPDGALWWGVESWPASPAGSYQILSRDPSLGLTIARPDALVALPGRTWEAGRKVGAAVYSTSPGAARVRVWEQTEGDAGSDPIKSGVQHIVREEMRRLVYLAVWPGRVIQQRASGALDVQLDSQILPWQTNVVLRVPVPGSRVSVPAGARVLLGFDGGDPQRAYAALWDLGAGGKPVARVGDKTKGHTHTATFALAANLMTGAVTGTITIATATDEMNEGSPHLSLPAGRTV